MPHTFTASPPFPSSHFLISSLDRSLTHPLTLSRSVSFSPTEVPSPTIPPDTAIEVTYGCTAWPASASSSPRRLARRPLGPLGCSQVGCGILH